MRKILIFLCLIFISFITTGCSQYFKVNQNDIVYYGAYNQRDFVHSDVKLYKYNSEVICDGIMFINSPSRAITLKNDFIDGKMLLSCSDGKLIDSKLQLTKATCDNLSGEGYDQLNNKYIFEAIDKSEFKEKSGIKKIQFINDKTKSLIKY